MSVFAGLFASEVRRFVSRRFFRWLAVAILALMATQAGVAFFTSSKDAESGLRQAQRNVEACERARQQSISEGYPEDSFMCPTFDEFLAGYDERFLYASAMKDAFQGLGVMALVVGLVAGASFVGAEWGTGSMTTLLTWVPRRGWVMLAKLTAAIAVVTVAVVAFLVLMSAAFFPAGALRGTTEGADGSFWWSQVGMVARNLALSTFGVTIGVGLATITRSTAGAVGAGLFYGTVGDFFLSVWRDGMLERWLLRYNVSRLLDVPVMPLSVSRSFGGQLIGFRPDSATRAFVILAVYVAAFALLSYAVFRRRDVS